VGRFGNEHVDVACEGCNGHSGKEDLEKKAWC
jgi:hypothetical protein